MKNLKIHHRSSGFGLVEVVISLAIVGILLLPILQLQFNVFNRFAVNKTTLEHVMPLKKIFMDMLINPLPQEQTEMEIKSSDPVMNIQYTKRKPKPGSALNRFQGLFIKTVTGQWDQWNGNKETALILFDFEPLELEQGGKK